MSTPRYDAVPVHRPDEMQNTSDSEADSDQEGTLRARGRTSQDMRRHDDETLNTEEEAERLLVGEEKFGGRDFGRQYQREGKSEPGMAERRDARSQRRRDGRKNRRRKREGEENELMYKVEEGERSSSSVESSGNSSEVDLHALKAVQAKRRSKTSRFGKFAAIHIVIIAAFLGLLFGAYRASRSMKRPGQQQASSPKLERLSNGTHEFEPTTVLISLDGFRADFLNRGLTPTLSSFIRDGVSPKYMLPSFPSLTFPNHFTIVTGLYPESHGIVGNTFWDPDSEKEFFYTDPARSMTPEWWLGEPLWETAELSGVRTAIHMWPGSEAHIGTMEPTFVDKFNADEKLENKVQRVLGWLDLPGPNDPGASDQTPRPQLIAAYVPNVDADGHAYGPNSTYIRSTIAEVDGMLEMLFQGIEDRNLTEIVNVVVVSDHGMATTSNHRLIQLEDLIDTSLIEHTDGWPLYGLRPYDHSEEHLHTLYKQLVDKSRTPAYEGQFEVYLRDENMPERYHFSKSHRIAPLWIVPTTGWAIVTKDEFNVEAALEHDTVYYPRGLHGYDHEHPLMRAIFVARGPAFPHPKGSQVDVFQNLEIYNIICDSLGVEPRPNNGTIRLPFETIGLHDFETADETPQDLPSEDSGVQFLPPTIPNLTDYPSVPGTRPTSVAATSPATPPGEDDEDGKGKMSKSWLEWIKGKVHDLKDWLAGATGKGGEDATPADETQKK